jgi:predicted negative regulator of RcsB-dependent stress response
VEDDLRSRIQHAIVTGDNRLKQGAGTAKARASYERALELAREAGLEEQVRPLIELRLTDLARLEAGSPPPAPPGA